MLLQNFKLFFYCPRKEWKGLVLSMLLQSARLWAASPQLEEEALWWCGQASQNTKTTRATKKENHKKGKTHCKSHITSHRAKEMGCLPTWTVLVLKVNQINCSHGKQVKEFSLILNFANTCLACLPIIDVRLMAGEGPDIRVRFTNFRVVYLPLN